METPIREFKSLVPLMDFFREEDTCRSYLASQRWGNDPSCPHCSSTNAYVTNRGYKCSDRDCAKKFSVTTGTIFENTKIKLRYWYAAIYLATAHKKGISSLQLSRDINVTQKTAWFMLHRIRTMMSNASDNTMNGIVEADETYIGGKTSNKHKWERDRRNSMGTGSMHMTGVLAMAQRKGMVVAKVIGKTVHFVVQPIIRQHVSDDATLVTDGHGAYQGLERQVINHTGGEFARGIFHTNTVEGFFSHLKRGIIGIYHYVSPKHLQAYVSEFSYRYNTRLLADGKRFSSVFGQVNCRLTYKDLILRNGKQA
jgi:transposase-like protein